MMSPPLGEYSVLWYMWHWAHQDLFLGALSGSTSEGTISNGDGLADWRVT